MVVPGFPPRGSTMLAGSQPISEPRELFSLTTDRALNMRERQRHVRVDGRVVDAWRSNLALHAEA